MRVRVATAALLAVTLLPAAAEGRTTDLFAFANKEDRPAGYLLRGDKIHVIAHRFIPKAVCKPKVHFTLTDSGGTKFKVGSAHPSFGDFGEGAMNRDLERVPAAAKPGKATIRSKQKCRLGSASGKDGIRIIDPGQPKPRVTQTGALDVLSGNKTTLAFQVDRYAYANVVVEWELVPGEWRLIDNVAPREFLPKADTYSLDWRAKAGGNVPAGHYRFRITPRAPGVGNGESVTQDFYVAELFGIQVGRTQLFEGASGISVDSAGRLLVADPPRNTVRVLDSSGKAIDGFGGGALAQPLDVAAQGGDAYIADTGNRRLARRPSGGTPVPFAGSAGTGPGQFSPSKGPQSVAATRSERRARLRGRRGDPPSAGLRLHRRAPADDHRRAVSRPRRGSPPDPTEACGWPIQRHARCFVSPEQARPSPPSRPEPPRPSTRIAAAASWRLTEATAASSSCSTRRRRVACGASGRGWWTNRPRCPSQGWPGTSSRRSAAACCTSAFPRPALRRHRIASTHG